MGMKMGFDKMKYGCPWFRDGKHHDDPTQSKDDECSATGGECTKYDCAPLYWANEANRSGKKQNVKRGRK